MLAPAGSLHCGVRPAALLPVLAALTIVVVAVVVTITRGPEFHRYADTRSWLGIPNAGDVLSNGAFLIAAVLPLRACVPAAYAAAARAGVFCIGLGSALYHVAPSDTLLAFDWAPIVLTLAVVGAAAIHDRTGPRAGLLALGIAPLFALGSVAWWLASGGTHGGNMAPYVAVQVTGIALPLSLAAVAPGAIRARYLVLGLIAFGVARLCASHDRDLLDLIGVSGHSLKHVAAAIAAGCALRSLSR